MTEEQKQVLRQIARLINRLLVEDNELRSKYRYKVIEEHPELFDREFLREYYMLRAIEEDNK